MHSLATFLASSMLAAADLGILVWATRRLGRRPKQAELLLLSLAVALKLALLVAGAAWISHQAWYQRPGLIAGLTAPFALFVLWQGLRLQVQRGKRAQ